MNVINQHTASSALQLINDSHNILIISHRSPDPDSLGSNFALRLALTALGKKVTSGCVDTAPSTCLFLPLSSTLTSQLNLHEFDLIISVDCGSTDQVALGKIFPDLFTIKPFINIDHHVSNNNFGTVNLVYTNFSSTSEIIYQLLKFWQLPLTADIATLLMMGLYYDTGSFKHSNVTPQVMEMAHDLMQHGAKLKLITANLFPKFPLNKFHLWGELLQKFQITSQNAAAAAINQELFAKHHATKEDLSGLIDYLVSVAGSEYAVLVHEDDKGNIKGSLRTSTGKVDLAALAAQLGGGGHKKASGFSFPGKIVVENSWAITSPS